MHWWSEFQPRVEHDVPLAPHTWFRLGGSARHVFHPESAEQLARFLRRARDEDVEVRVLGRGANVLVPDEGFDGVVVRLDDEVFREERWSGGVLHVGGGVDVWTLAKRCSDAGWSGLECMAGIPAWVGGAARMNAGGRFGSFGDVLASVTACDFNGRLVKRAAADCGLGYRTSNLSGVIVVEAALRLARDPSGDAARRFEEYSAIKKQSQPLAAHCAGCTFKNPPEGAAGAIIERAGLKGLRCGGAVVSDRHANFLVAGPGGTATDVMRLIDLVREEVLRREGIELELEVDVWRSGAGVIA